MDGRKWSIPRLGAVFLLSAAMVRNCQAQAVQAPPTTAPSLIQISERLVTLQSQIQDLDKHVREQRVQSSKEPNVSAWGGLRDVLLYGVTAGVLSSFIFWWLLRLRRPQLRFGPHLARGFSKVHHAKSDTEGDAPQKKIVYRVKLLNVSNRSVVNLRARCMITYMDKHAGGEPRRQNVLLQLSNHETFALGPHRNSTDMFAITPWWVLMVVGTQKEPDKRSIEQLMQKPEARFQVTISAADEVSGVVKVVRYSYSYNEFEDGDFVSGRTFEISAQSDDALAPD